MKLKASIACLAAACALLTGCIQDEALNVEAAIDACTGGDIQQATIDPNNFTVQLYVSRAADLSRVNINFTLPEGATIAPVTQLPGDDIEASTYYFEGEENRVRQFRVTSEDGDYSATYSLTLWQTEMPTNYHFETLSSSSPYHVFYEQEDEGRFIRRLEWASGNPGYQLTAEASSATGYPTVQMATGGMNGGRYTRLETKSTGSFGEMVGMPLAAGNLFIGSFDRTNAVKDPMGATLFGFPFFYYPVKLEGWYMYSRGEVFTSDGEVVADRQDECDIYGVMYETDDETSFLNGANSLTSPNIVALARLPQGQYWPETDRWTKFSLDFEPQNGKTIDADKLSKGQYKLAIVFSSSVDGGNFNGAAGSVLCIDEVNLTVTDQPTTNN